AALVALAIAASARARPALVAAALLGVAWLADAIGALRTFREAALLSGELVRQAAAARAALPPDVELFVVDVPFALGEARDVPVGNWGFAQAIALTGARGAVTQLYTSRQPASTAGRVVAP